MGVIGAWFVAAVGTVLVALLGAVAGGLTAVALTLSLAPADLSVFLLLGLVLLLVCVPLGAIGAVWLLSLIADERSAQRS